MRAGPLLAGVAAAYAYRTPAVMEALATRHRAATAGLVIAVLAAVLATSWPLFAGVPRAVEVLYLGVYRTVFGASVAYVVLLSLSDHPAGRALGRALSARTLYPFAQLAYAAYLLNPIVAQQVHRALSPLVQSGGFPAMAILAPADLAATFLSATAMHLLVERPFMELRPRAS
jgi:peptidoglycan/LPS O-acetylase OafA/YrhL